MDDRGSDADQDGPARPSRLRAWANSALEYAYAFAVSLSFARLSTLIIVLALVSATAFAVTLWDVLYGVRGTPIVVVTLLVALLTATPLTVFVVYVIRRAEDAHAELARSNAALEEARDQAETANQAKTHFLANISHELRTPLNAVIGFSEIMRNETFGPLGSPKYREYVEDIHRSGAYLLDLIDDILDVSRIETSTYVLREESIDLGAILDEVISLVLPRAEAAGIEVRMPVSSTKLHSLHADPRAMKQMLVNLVTNGIKFTPRGGWVQLSHRLEPDGALVLAVEDTGPGIAPEDVEDALAPFTRLGDAMTREIEGVGLGLSLTKSLVELHGGKLTVAGEEGTGAIVELRFPSWRVARTLAGASPSGDRRSA